MTDLRQRIIKALAGSSSQKTVPQEQLLALNDDPQKVKAELDQLYTDRIALRIVGFRNSKPYADYWLSGAPAPVSPFRVTTPAPPFQQPPAAKVQPNTSTPGEQPMPSKKPTIGISQAVCEAVSARPGLNFSELLAAVKKTIPEVTEKQLTNNLYVMASAKKISTIGEGADRTYHLGDKAGKVRAAPPPKAAAIKPAAVKMRKAAKAKPPRAEKSQAVAALTGYVFGVNRLPGGGMQIHKNGATLEFTSHEVRTILEHAPA